MSELFPEPVAAFLQGNVHPEAILPYLQQDDADSRMARLIGFGLIPSLLNAMLEGAANQMTCRVLLHVAVHTDGPWQRFMCVRHFRRSLNAGRVVIIPPKNNVPDANIWCIAVAIARFATGKMGTKMSVLGLSAKEKAGATSLLPIQSRRPKKSLL
jgi:hypothetical protein